jgi:flagellar biosynthetic protein FliO
VDFMVELLKLIVVLALVLLAAVYVIRFGLTRLQPESYRRQGAMKVVERLALNQKSWLCLVKAGEKYVLLAVSTGGVNKISELSAEEVEPLLHAEEVRDFKSYLQKFRKTDYRP